jgi:hypothetical protein
MPLASRKLRISATIVERCRIMRGRVSRFPTSLSDQCCALSILTCDAVVAAVMPSIANDGSAALCTARSYGQLASLNAPEAVIALVDRKEAVPLNWT